MTSRGDTITFLRLLADVVEVSRRIGTRSYVWGGLVVDVLGGGMLRAHHDLDCFTLDLSEYQPRLIDRFESLGYTVTVLEDFQILRIDRDEVHAAFNPLTVSGQTASWHHVGKRGRVDFPVEWLDDSPRLFHGIDVYTSGARFEFAIKTHPELLNPEWRARAKDRDAIERLRRHIDRDGFADLDFLRDITSFTPFWADRGYPQYARPIKIGESAKHPRVSLDSNGTQ